MDGGLRGDWGPPSTLCVRAGFHDSAMLTLAVSHLSPSEALFWIAALIALGCLVAAGYCAFHDRWLATVLLVVVALFIGVIFLA